MMLIKTLRMVLHAHGDITEIEFDCELRVDNAADEV